MDTINKNDRFDNYQKMVESLADLKINFPFDNSSAKHAAVVFANILRTCDDVLIYDTHLEGDIAYEHGSFINELNKFAQDKSKKLTIVIQNDENIKEKTLFRSINELKSENNVKIFKSSNDFSKKMLKLNLNGVRNNLINFTVGDKRAYRIEKFSKNLGFYKATCDFNDVAISTKLTNEFKNALSSCEQIN